MDSIKAVSHLVFNLNIHMLKFTQSHERELLLKCLHIIQM
jgi:hypothetical protein